MRVTRGLRWGRDRERRRSPGWWATGALAALVGCDAQPAAPPGWATTPTAATNPTSATGTDGPDATTSSDAVDPEVAAYVPTPPTFACVPGSQSVSPLRRLTRLQYTNTLHDLVAWALGDAARADAIMASLEAPLAQIPGDDTRLEGKGQDITQAHVEGHYEAAEDVAAALTADADTIARLVGACATDADTGNDQACIMAFIERFGARALRRPLTPAELAFFRDDAFASAIIQPTPLRDLVTVMLMAPPVVFHLETGGEPVAGTDDVYTLSAWELAARLSYHFWQTAPDDALVAAAADGSLLTEVGYRTQVERVFADPRTAATLDAFITQWLDLERIPQPADEVGTEPFDTFAGADRPTPALQRNMIKEVVDLARYHTWTVDGDLDDLFLTDLSFATTPDLAAIYDVPVWDGASEPPRFEPGERAGLLTRAAMLVSGTWHTLPIHKGIVIRRRILCDTLGQPPEGAQGQTVELEGAYTQRTYAEELTMRDGTSCELCHSWMNPIGFATEGYDGLGRRRDEEMFWDESTGDITWLPIDTRTVPRADKKDPRPAADAIEATQLALESGKPHACVARFYFRFTFGRLEEVTEDGCLLERLRAGLIAGEPLATVLRDVALAPEFKVRRVGPEAAPAATGAGASSGGGGSHGQE